MKNKSESNVYKSNNKGISLIILVITIIIALLIITTVIMLSTSEINDAQTTMFAKNLMEIQDATEGYYITNNLMPLLDDSTVMNKDEIISIARFQDILLEELTENNDLDSQFYKLDLDKIEITKVPYGNMELGENDIFVIAYPSMNAYYLYGLEVSGETYFSITSKISNVTKTISSQLDTSTTTVISSGGITVTKTNGWANKMGVNIEVEMAEYESLYMSVSGDTTRLITTTSGQNIFGFNLLSSIINDTETIKVPTLTLEEANYIELGTKPLSDRYVEILKYKNSEIIGKVRIDLSNFSKNLPTLTSEILSSYSTMNTVKLSLASSEAGIREVRYEYLTKYLDDGTIVNYDQNYSDFDATYMQSKSRKVQFKGDLVVTINAPKNVQSIKIALIDKAGNINLYNQEIAPRLYIGYTIDINTSESLQLTAKMFSANGIKSITFSRSADGVNFTDEQAYTLDTTTNGVTTKQSLPYTNYVAYIKMVAVNYDSTITETRIINTNLVQAFFPPPLVELGVIATQNSTINGEAAAYNNPIIPTGFKAINDGTIWPTDWNTGLVIEDVSGNQFVWVPVDGTNVPYAKWCTAIKAYDYPGITDDTLPTGITNEMSQITNYSGFYIARYEAGNASNVLVSKKNATVWNSTIYIDSKAKAESMYTTAEVKSGLVTGTQWDTVMKWVQNSGKNVTTDSITWGNYSNSVAPANVSGYGSLKTTGYSEYWKANNIYDLAGNTFEWSTELYNISNSVARSGDYNDDGSVFSTSCRFTFSISYVNVAVAFRTVLYIL
ncbi:MAG: hypothetical protein PHD15_06930 [Clostridia bacterium]|nr:hypothetical protein [Clostridia bacterium]MDD4387463.1 hypothetical protein [Clostridia bacterium]